MKRISETTITLVMHFDCLGDGLAAIREAQESGTIELRPRTILHLSERHGTTSNQSHGTGAEVIPIHARGAPDLPAYEALEEQLLDAELEE
ncbi:MAG: hypothetical protein AAGF48_13965 [Pseudomonadota bacterium]